MTSLRLVEFVVAVCRCIDCDGKRSNRKSDVFCELVSIVCFGRRRGFLSEFFSA